MTIRYGIIGTGMMGCEHIRNLVKIDKAQVVAIADPNEQPRQWAQMACRSDEVGKSHTPDIYADYRDLIARNDIDAVVIASPNFTHIDVMRDVFETDKHVLLEKPMCTTVEDSLEIVRRAKGHKGIVWVGLEYRYMTPIARFLSEIKRGAVGDLKMFFIREHRHPFLKKVGDWNRFNRNSGGTLVEKCCHFFDMMNLVVNAIPVSVYASGAQNVNHLDEVYDGEVPDILDNAFVIVDYDNGVRACLDLCMFAESSRNEQELVATGNAGKLEVTIPDNMLTIGGREYQQNKSIKLAMDPRVQEAGFHHGASYLEHLDFIDAIESGKPAQVTAEDGLLSVAMGIAAQQSIARHQPILIEDVLRPEPVS
jgi:myo-inositol 2-dehydrogenase / D-chiro-inositol 1-dehydrogenase